MPIQLVVFDLAGTTVKDNNDVHRVLQSTLLKHDVAITVEDANAVMGIPKPVAIRELLKKYCSDAALITAEWVEEIHQQFVGEMIWFYQASPTVGEKEGVSSTFQQLKARGIKVAVNTGFSRPITDPLLHRLGWIKNDLLDCSVTSDEVARGRPYPDLIFEAMKRTGVSDASKVVKVGDTAVDIQEGKAAGCGITVAVTTGAFSSTVLQQENPSYLIEQIPQLLDLID
jgi:phosphonatase-like hydrolase